MFLAGPAPLPGEYRFLALGDLQRELPADAAERTLVAVDCANESRLGADPAVLHLAPFTLNIDHHHDNSRFGDVDRRRRRGVLDGRVAARRLRASSASS